MFKDVYEEIKEYTTGKTTDGAIKESYVKEKYEKNEQRDLYGNPVEDKNDTEYHRMKEEENNEENLPNIDDKLTGKYQKNDDQIQKVMEDEPVEMPETEQEKKKDTIEELAEREQKEEDDETNR